MNDTTAVVATIVQARHQAMTAEQRMRAAAAMFESARCLVDASLGVEIDVYARRLACVRRLYGNELPAAALIAHANWPTTQMRTTDGLDP